MRIVLAALFAAVSGIVFGYFVLSPGSAEDHAIPADTKALIRGLEDDLARQGRETASLKRRLDEAEAARRAAESRTTEAVEARLASERALARQSAESANEVADAPSDPAKEKPAPTFASFDEALTALRENPNMLLVDAQAARDFMKMLEALGDEGTAKVLALLESEESSDRIAAAQLLLQLGDPAAIKPLGEAVVNDTDAEAAAWASQALIRLDGDGAKEALQNALANSPHEAVKVNSLWGLCRHEDPDGIARTLSYYQDTENNAEMRRALGLGALALNSASVMPIIDAVSSRESDSAPIMQRVIDYYGRVPGPEATQRLLSISQNVDLSDGLRTRARKLLDKR